MTHKMQKWLGSLQWLATSTRPDIVTITNVLSQYTHKASKGHLDAVKRVLRYLKGTKNLGITFHSATNSNLQSFVKFPLDPNSTTPFTDTNWGPQDLSTPKRSSEIRTLQIKIYITIHHLDQWPVALDVQTPDYHSTNLSRGGNLRNR